MLKENTETTETLTALKKERALLKPFALADDRRRSRCDRHPEQFQPSCPACRQKLAHRRGLLTAEGVGRELY